MKSFSRARLSPLPHLFGSLCRGLLLLLLTPLLVFPKARLAAQSAGCPLGRSKELLRERKRGGGWINVLDSRQIRNILINNTFSKLDLVVSQAVGNLQYLAPDEKRK